MESTNMSMQNQGQLIADMISEGAYRLARDTARHAHEHFLEKGIMPDADFLFQYILAMRMCGMPTVHLESELKQTPGFTTIMTVDLLRDEILMMCRTGRAEQAVYSLHRLAELSAETGDANRCTAVLMTEERVNYALKEYHEAYDKFDKANYIWEAAGNAADAQWRSNNRYWLLKSWVMSNHHGACKAKYGRLHLQDLVADDGNKRHRRHVAIIDRYGRFGVRFVDLLEKGVGRLRLSAHF